MGATKEYFLKLSEERYQLLAPPEVLFLNELGLEVRQLPSEKDLEDERVILYRKEIARNYRELDKYLFEIRNK